MTPDNDAGPANEGADRPLRGLYLAAKPESVPEIAAHVYRKVPEPIDDAMVAELASGISEANHGLQDPVAPGQWIAIPEMAGATYLGDCEPPRTPPVADDPPRRLPDPVLPPTSDIPPASAQAWDESKSEITLRTQVRATGELDPNCTYWRISSRRMQWSSELEA
jgi:hypothetical protein